MIMTRNLTASLSPLAISKMAASAAAKLHGTFWKDQTLTGKGLLMGWFFCETLGVFKELTAHLSNEKRAPGLLGYIGDEILPSYIGIIINHYKDPY